MKSNSEEFIKKCDKVYGGMYDYSEVEYVNNSTKVKIICPEHGEFFKRPTHHLNRLQGCPKCSHKKLGESQMKSNGDFINQAKLIHGDKYDYSKVNYQGNKTKIKIICSEHGEFDQIPDNHLKGKGCRYCGGTSKLDSKLFIIKAKKVHGDKYNYSKVDYIDSKTKINIICSEHGEFSILPNNHLCKCQGCLRCLNRVFDTKSFIKKAKEIHGNNYDYANVNFINMNELIDISCNVHGISKQTPIYHLNNFGCKKCGNSMSLIEREVSDFITSLNINFEENDRSVLNGKELDIYIPSKKIAIEFNGLYWHSELFKDKNYHLDKTELCEKEEIQLIHIFEDEWLYKQDIVKSRLKNLLGLTETMIYGRKCVIKNVSSKITKSFLDDNHIQGKCVDKIRYGLYHQDELVSIMTFGKRKILNNDGWELIRFCNKLNTSVIGGASKLFKHFIKTHVFETLISYADRRWSDGGLYNNLGFEYISKTPPNYFYYNENLKTRESRIKYQKHKLVTQGFDVNLTEREITNKMGLYRIYDSGNLKYIYRN
jgi:hypothetical protein